MVKKLDAIKIYKIAEYGNTGTIISFSSLISLHLQIIRQETWAAGDCEQADLSSMAKK